MLQNAAGGHNIWSLVHPVIWSLIERFALAVPRDLANMALSSRASAAGVISRAVPIRDNDEINDQMINGPLTK
jgi:hypothetical protein